MAPDCKSGSLGTLKVQLLPSPSRARERRAYIVFCSRNPMEEGAGSEPVDVRVRISPGVLIIICLCSRTENAAGLNPAPDKVPL